MDEASWVWLLFFLTEYAITVFFKKLLEAVFLLPKASRAFQLVFKGAKAVIWQVGRRNVIVLFGLPFPRLLSSVPFFMCEELFCITPTMFPIHFFPFV